MSILHTIEVDIEKLFKGTGTDLEKFANGFVKLFKRAPTALQMVENFTGEAALVVEAAVGLADPALEAPVAAVLSTIETGLAAIQASAANAVSGNSLLQDLTNFAESVPALLTGVAIKNPALQATLTRLVNLVVGECKVLIPAVEGWVKRLQQAQGIQGATAGVASATDKALDAAKAQPTDQTLPGGTAAAPATAQPDGNATDANRHDG